MLRYNFIYGLLVLLFSCNSSDKIIETHQNQLILNVKSDNIHYTRALVQNFIQKHALQLISDKKSKIGGRYRVMEMEFSISTDLISSFLSKSEIDTQIPETNWESKKINNLKLKIHYVK